MVSTNYVVHPIQFILVLLRTDRGEHKLTFFFLSEKLQNEEVFKMPFVTITASYELTNTIINKLCFLNIWPVTSKIFSISFSLIYRWSYMELKIQVVEPLVITGRILRRRCVYLYYNELFIGSYPYIIRI
jgi:hypothetical protein